jgi:hypothetical protein
MPQNDEDKLVLELKPCSRCGNPFMVKKGQDLAELVCENCIKLDERKRELQIGVFKEVVEVENKMEDSIKQMTNSLIVSKGAFNKQFFLDKIKKRAEVLNRSIELIEKIEATNDEKYIDEYKKLFESMKKEYS